MAAAAVSEIKERILDEKPSRQELHRIKHKDENIRIKDTVASDWRGFAIALYLDRGNNLDALFKQCFKDPIEMAEKICDMYLGNQRELEPPVVPSWREILEALRDIRENEVVRKLDEYLYSKALSRASELQTEEADPVQETKKVAVKVDVEGKESAVESSSGQS